MKQLEQSEFYNWWLQKYHNTTIEEIIEKEPDLAKTSAWYKKYACTQQQHDEWYEWAIERIAKHYRCGKKSARRKFIWDYLNIAPYIKKDEK